MINALSGLRGSLLQFSCGPKLGFDSRVHRFVHFPYRCPLRVMKMIRTKGNKRKWWTPDRAEGVKYKDPTPG
jgi:hypothetical protein